MGRTAAKPPASGLSLSNLDKVMYPGTGFTKGQVIDYYRRVAPYVLPHLKDRPITLKRFPNGIGSAHFYEKNAPSFTPDWIQTFAVARNSESGTIHYILINDLPTLVWSANMANLELHPFLAKAPYIDRPTMVVFDLDPGEGADILLSCRAAFLVKELLDRLQLQCFAKVSGSKGIHLHVPLNGKVTYEATRPFAKSIAQLLESEHPDLILSQMAKTKRKGKVFVDWSQNSEHKSTVAVYSLRAKRERPFVALPVSWDELGYALKKHDPSLLFFEPQAALKRLKKTGDLFAPVVKVKQELPEPFLELMADSAAAAQPAGDLDAYRKKRNFTKTPEPPPSTPRSRAPQNRRLFVLQKHAASHLHYDLRFEMGGTLKSWAVPKGPPYDLNERRLAMAVEDHPMEYAGFEGIIPKGEYGGGTVMVWDRGSYELIDGNYWQGKLHVLLDGKKLKGEWVLVRAEKRDGKDNVWYWIKAGAGMARPSAKSEDSSAVTGRSMAEIAQLKDAVWHSRRRLEAKNAHQLDLPGPDLEALPDQEIKFISPMLAQAVSELPQTSDEWLYEIKLDGYRCLAGRDSRGVTLWSRRKNVFTSQFPGIADACRGLEPGTLVDGEIVALDDAGRPSFNTLQHSRASAKQINFYAFDLLVYQGKSLLLWPLEQRRAMLEAAIAPAGEAVQMSEAFDGTPGDIAAAAGQLGLEGIVAKRKNSQYQPGKRTGLWVKYKLNKAQEFVIGGYTPGNPFQSLIVGDYRDGQLNFVAKVKDGFVPHVRREVRRKFKGLETDHCPFANLPEKKRTPTALTKQEMKQCRWLLPKLVAQIEFTEWTPDAHLRQSKFIGLRKDKDARDVVREITNDPERRK